MIPRVLKIREISRIFLLRNQVERGLNHCYISLQLNTLRPRMVSVTTMSSLGRRLRHEVEAMRRQKCVLQQREPCAVESLLLNQVHSDMARVKKEGAYMSATKRSRPHGAWGGRGFATGYDMVYLVQPWPIHRKHHPSMLMHRGTRANMTTVRKHPSRSPTFRPVGPRGVIWSSREHALDSRVGSGRLLPGAPLRRPNVPAPGPKDPHTSGHSAETKSLSENKHLINQMVSGY
jgi:hypothetical protein